MQLLSIVVYVKMLNWIELNICEYIWIWTYQKSYGYTDLFSERQDLFLSFYNIIILKQNE